MTIFKYPQEVLRKKAIQIERITREIFEFTEEMIKTMLENDGVGLAANQVGSEWNLFIINLKPFEKTPEPIVVINPKIIKLKLLII